MSFYWDFKGALALVCYIYSRPLKHGQTLTQYGNISHFTALLYVSFLISCLLLACSLGFSLMLLTQNSVGLQCDVWINQ